MSALHGQADTDERRQASGRRIGQRSRRGTDFFNASRHTRRWIPNEGRLCATYGGVARAVSHVFRIGGLFIWREGSCYIFLSRCRKMGKWRIAALLRTPSYEKARIGESNSRWMCRYEGSRQARGWRRGIELGVVVPLKTNTDTRN